MQRGLRVASSGRPAGSTRSPAPPLASRAGLPPPPLIFDVPKRLGANAGRHDGAGNSNLEQSRPRGRAPRAPFAPRQCDILGQVAAADRPPPRRQCARRTAAAPLRPARRCARGRDPARPGRAPTLHRQPIRASASSSWARSRICGSPLRRSTGSCSSRARSSASGARPAGRAALKGYVIGREIRQGCMIPSIGGGICQLTNALSRVAHSAGMEIVERHSHTRPSGGLLHRRRDRRHRVLELYRFPLPQPPPGADRRAAHRDHARRPAGRAAVSRAPRSCASCDETGCAMNKRHGAEPAGAHAPRCSTTSGPKMRAWSPRRAAPRTNCSRPACSAPGPAAIAGPGRPSIAPRSPPRAAISPCGGSPRRPAGCASAPISTHDRQRRAGAGAGRSTIAPAIWWSRRAWLPWLDEAGALGGRSFDVVDEPLSARRNPPHARRRRGRDRPVRDDRRFPRRSRASRARGGAARPRAADRHAAPRHRRDVSGPGAAARLASPAAPHRASRALESPSSARPSPASGPTSSARLAELARRAADRVRRDARAAVGRSGDRAAAIRAGLARRNRRDPSPGDA